jgi:hypothetical protein
MISKILFLDLLLYIVTAHVIATVNNFFFFRFPSKLTFVMYLVYHIKMEIKFGF